MARIDRPRRQQSYLANAGSVIDIAGLAWAVHRGISKVEVSIDEGEWRECELAGVPSDDTWRQWRYPWTGQPWRAQHRRPGDRRRRRAQEEDEMSPAPNGAQGYHHVSVDVS